MDAMAGDYSRASGGSGQGSQPVAGGRIKPGYDPSLTNEDLAPLREQTWTSYNIFAFWMSDVHSVGGYITAAAVRARACRAGRCWWRCWWAS